VVHWIKPSRPVEIRSQMVSFRAVSWETRATCGPANSQGVAVWWYGKDGRNRSQYNPRPGALQPGSSAHPPQPDADQYLARRLVWEKKAAKISGGSSSGRGVRHGR
jgi:hypothetical protein